MTTYLLDSNVFIEAKNHFYGFDICPAFWEWIDAAHESGSVFSVEKVGDELLGYSDELSTWAAERGSLFLKPDAAVVSSLQGASIWATGADYEPAAVTTFLQVADSYLVAHAHAYGHVLVTRELVRPSTKKIMIPNACFSLGVKFMSPFEMLRIEKARFVLATAAS